MKKIITYFLAYGIILIISYIAIFEVKIPLIHGEKRKRNLSAVDWTI